MRDSEAVAVLVRQRVDRNAEDHRVTIAIGVEQPDRAGGAGERGSQQREDRCDAAPGGERHDVALAGELEEPRRRGDVDDVVLSSKEGST